MEASLDCLEVLTSGVARRLENWAEDVWSDTRRLARLSGSEDTGSTRPRLGRGAMVVVVGLSAAVLPPTSLVVSRYLEAAEMAAAVRPTVAISIWRVLMMLSAVMIGLRASALTIGLRALLGRVEAAPCATEDEAP